MKAHIFLFIFVLGQHLMPFLLAKPCLKVLFSVRLDQLTMVSGNFLSGPIIMIITSAGCLAIVMSGFFRQSVRENKIPGLVSIKWKMILAFYVALFFVQDSF